MFDDLRVGGEVYYSNSKLMIVELSGKAGFITFRPVSRSGDPAIDVNVPGVRLKLHYPEWRKVWI